MFRLVSIQNRKSILTVTQFVHNCVQYLSFIQRNQFDFVLPETYHRIYNGRVCRRPTSNTFIKYFVKTNFENIWIDSEKISCYHHHRCRNVVDWCEQKLMLQTFKKHLCKYNISMSFQCQDCIWYFLKVKSTQQQWCFDFFVPLCRSVLKLKKAEEYTKKGQSLLFN